MATTAGAIKVTARNGALTVTLTAATGTTPTVYSDESGTTTVSLPVSLAQDATTTLYVPSNGTYNLSVKTASGYQIAGRLGATRALNLSAGTVAALEYDAQLGVKVPSSTGEVSPVAAGSGTYVLQLLAPLGPRSFPARPHYTMIQTFQSGHGWTGAGNTGGSYSAFADDATDYTLGSQSIKATTNGTGGSVTLSKVGLTAMNLTGKSVAVLLKVNNADRLADVYLMLGTSSFAVNRSIRLNPIVGGGTGASANGWSSVYQWYHCSVEDSSSSTGTIDIAAVTDLRIFVYDRNTGGVTVNVQAVGHFTQPATYPNGVVSFTFDDCLLSQYSLATRAFDKYGDGASAFVITDIMGRTSGQGDLSGGRFSTDQAHTLEALHGWEIGGHAYSESNHGIGYPSLSASALDDELYSMKAWLRSEGFRGADWFAWPLGSSDGTTADAITRFFSWGRHTNGNFNPLVADQPMRARSITLNSDSSTSVFTAHIDTAKAKKKWLIFNCHQVVASGASGSTNINLADLQTIVDYCHTVGVPIRTVGDVIGSVGVEA